MPGSSGWVLRPAAEADLSEIWLDGAERWGVEQADRYADGLFALFDLLAAYPEMAREREEFTPPVRIHPSGSHLVIYRREGQGVEIIRILHTHQDLMAYLNDG
jgi:toxin ParE1/3/4